MLNCHDSDFFEHYPLYKWNWHYTVKPVLSGPFIKRNFVLNRNIFRSRDYHSIPQLNGNVVSPERCSGPLRFRLRQVLLYFSKKGNVPTWCNPLYIASSFNITMILVLFKDTLWNVMVTLDQIMNNMIISIFIYLQLSVTQIIQHETVGWLLNWIRKDVESRSHGQILRGIFWRDWGKLQIKSQVRMVGVLAKVLLKPTCLEWISKDVDGGSHDLF
jgi:hypothetical protein